MVLDKLIEILKEVIGNKLFFGSITINIESGKIVNVKKTESLK